MKGIRRCNFADKGEKIDGRLRIGAIGNGPDHGKGNTELETDLGNRCAFHLDSKQIRKMRPQFVQALGAADKFIAAGNQSAMHTRLMQMKSLLPTDGNRLFQIVFKKLSCRFGKMIA